MPYNRDAAVAYARAGGTRFATTTASPWTRSPVTSSGRRPRSRPGLHLYPERDGGGERTTTRRRRSPGSRPRIFFEDLDDCTTLCPVPSAPTAAASLCRRNSPRLAAMGLSAPRTWSSTFSTLGRRPSSAVRRRRRNGADRGAEARGRDRLLQLRQRVPALRRLPGRRQGRLPHRLPRGFRLAGVLLPDLDPLAHPLIHAPGHKRPLRLTPLLFVPVYADRNDRSDHDYFGPRCLYRRAW